MAEITIKVKGNTPIKVEVEDKDPVDQLLEDILNDVGGDGDEDKQK